MFVYFSGKLDDKTSFNHDLMNSLLLGAVYCFHLLFLICTFNVLRVWCPHVSEHKDNEYKNIACLFLLKEVDFVSFTQINIIIQIEIVFIVYLGNNSANSNKNTVKFHQTNK